MRWLKLLLVIALNAIPFYGALYMGWSISTILALYWIETVLIFAATALRIVLHRIWTRKCGHWMGYQAYVENGITFVPPNANGFLRDYLDLPVKITLVHGVFVGLLVFGMSQKYPDDSMWHFSLDQFERGALSMLVVIVTDLLVDASVLRRRSFGWLKTYANRRTLRVFIMHVTIIVGMVAAAMAGSALGLLGVLVGLKTLFDASSAWFGEQAPPDDAPAQPSAWQSRMLKVAGLDDRKREEFMRKWHDDCDRRRELSGRDEQVMPAT
jgi:hypothetical protein